MKFSNYLEGIENVEIWPIISLIIFTIFFVILLYGVFKMDKRYIQKMKNMPLEKNNNADTSLENKIL